MVWIVRFVVAAIAAIVQWFVTPLFLRLGALQALLSLAVFFGVTFVLVSFHGLKSADNAAGKLSRVAWPQSCELSPRGCALGGGVASHAQQMAASEDIDWRDRRDSCSSPPARANPIR